MEQSNDLTGFAFSVLKLAVGTASRARCFLLRNLSSNLAGLLQGWKENCCLCSCLRGVCVMGLHVVFLLYGGRRAGERHKWNVCVLHTVNLQSCGQHVLVVDTYGNVLMAFQ